MLLAGGQDVASVEAAPECRSVCWPAGAAAERRDLPLERQTEGLVLEFVVDNPLDMQAVVSVVDPCATI